MAVSADGKSVYVASSTDAVARLNRSTTTGAISQPAGAAGCISETGAGPCANGHGLRRPASVAVSPDGKSVYVASPERAVARLNRNPTTGAISQPAGTAGCISEDRGGGVRRRPGAQRPDEVAVSPDGKSVYVASYSSNAVARLNRNTTTGAISQPAGTAGCLSETGAGPAPTAMGSTVRVGWRSARTGRASTSLRTAQRRRGAPQPQRTTGAISQPAGTAGCVSEDGTGGPAPTATGSTRRTAVAVSPDGKSVYVASYGSTPWRASTATRPPGRSASPPAPRLRQRDGAGPCADGHGLDGPRRWRSAPMERASTSPHSTATPWRASTGRPDA